MGHLLIEDVPDDIRDGLSRRAERNGRSLEAEALDILRDAAANDSERAPLAPLGTLIASMFEGLGLTEDIPEIRGPVRIVDFGA